MPCFPRRLILGGTLVSAMPIYAPRAAGPLHPTVLGQALIRHNLRAHP
jgi:hypothetical protein